jgi:hypothetical protein
MFNKKETEQVEPTISIVENHEQFMRRVEHASRTLSSVDYANFLYLEMVDHRAKLVDVISFITEGLV